MGRHVACMGKRRGAYGVVVEKTEKRRSPERLRRRWEDNIKMDLREVGWGHELDQSGLRQGQVAGCCECGNEPSQEGLCSMETERDLITASHTSRSLAVHIWLPALLGRPVPLKSRQVTKSSLRLIFVPPTSSHLPDCRLQLYTSQG